MCKNEKHHDNWDSVAGIATNFCYKNWLTWFIPLDIISPRHYYWSIITIYIENPFYSIPLFCKKSPYSIKNPVILFVTFFYLRHFFITWILIDTYFYMKSRFFITQVSSSKCFLKRKFSVFITWTCIVRSEFDMKSR